MLTSKQRASLRAMANNLEPIIYVGKSGLTENVLTQVDDALTARELIKGTVQQNAPVTAAQMAAEIAAATGAEAISASGRKFVLYRARPEDPTIRI